MDNTLAVCTWTFGPRPLDEVCRIASKLGLGGIELFGAIDRVKPAEARKLTADHGLAIVSITPDNVDIAHPDKGVRQRGLDYYAALLDWAAALGNPIIGIHGDVGRHAPVISQPGEYDLLVRATADISAVAATRGQTLVWEVLNRYESHLVNTAGEAVAFTRDVGAPNLKILLDAYHMNIEEADPAAAIRQAGTQLGLVHVADSNRRGLGGGHTDMAAIVQAARAVRYAGPIVIECTAAGPNPFTPVKEGDYLGTLIQYIDQSARWLRAA